MCACASRLDLRLRVARGHSEAKRSDGYKHLYIYIYNGGSVRSTRVGSRYAYCICPSSQHLMFTALFLVYRSFLSVLYLSCIPTFHVCCTFPGVRVISIYTVSVLHPNTSCSMHLSWCMGHFLHMSYISTFAPRIHCIFPGLQSISTS